MIPSYMAELFVVSLLGADAEWHWAETQKRSFERLKLPVTNAPTLQHYDVNEPIALSVDASSEGIGAAIPQDGQPVAYGSRAVNDGQIEK